MAELWSCRRSRTVSRLPRWSPWAWLQACNRTVLYLVAQLGTKERPRTQKWGTGQGPRVDRGFGFATPCCGPSLPQSTKQSAARATMKGGLVPEIATRQSDRASAFLQRHAIPEHCLHRHAGLQHADRAGIADANTFAMRFNDDTEMVSSAGVAPSWFYSLAMMPLQMVYDMQLAFLCKVIIGSGTRVEPPSTGPS